jgi:hypothetical protein
MTFTNPHLYVTMGGRAGGSEIWQTGCRFVNASIQDTFSDWQYIQMSAFADAGELLVDALAAVWPNDIYLDWVKVARIGTNGLYLGDPLVHELEVPQAGASTDLFPLQVAWCVSLRSTVTMGRATRGRMYLPSLYQPRTSGAPYSSYSYADAIKAAMAGMLNEWEAAASPQVVRNLSIMSKVGTGTTRQVTSIKVGTTADTIRDRRNSMPEVYQSTPYPPA